MRKIYPTDLSDEEWALLRARLPELHRTVRMRTHSLRDVFDAVFYVLRSGCPWRLVPGDFPPWSTVYYHFRRFRLDGLWHRVFTVLRTAERGRFGKDPDASAAIVDSQSVKTTEEGIGSNGYDAHKNVKGRNRHLLVDTLSLPLSVYVTPADVQDRAGARLLLAGLGPLVPRLKKIWADGAYSGKELARWCAEQGGWEIEVVKRDKEAKGFEVLPKRWILERTFGWLRRDRHLAKDYERKVQTSETLIEVAMIRLMLRRLAKAA
ncbi:MAG: IS5 family transposase [Actinomycetota bacterium]|nr:IS5 family transposase [Actinomycetota bacterium]